MKKLLLIVIILPLHTKAQWSCMNWITFSPADTTSPYIGLYRAVTIDSINFHSNIWQVGEPHKDVFTSGWPYPNVIVTDTLNPYPPNDTSVFILKIPAEVYVYSIWHNLTEITFVYQLDIDSGTIAMVEISVDSGLHWTNVMDSLPFGFQWNGDTPILSSSTAGWTDFSLIIGVGWIDSNVLFRFTFISDSIASSKDGWIIDDIAIDYWCETIVPQVKGIKSITIFPNPATTQLTIQSTNKPITQISITNLLGQTIYAQTFNSQQAQVNVASFSTGVYFIKINGTEMRKFVKE